MACKERYNLCMNHVLLDHVSTPTNATISFSSEYIKRENSNFSEIQLLLSGLFSSPSKLEL